MTNIASIAIILCTTTVVLAYLGRTADKDYMKGLFSTLTIYLLTVNSALARSFSETELGIGVVSNLVGYIFIALLLISLFVTFLMVVQYIIQLMKWIKERKKGIGGQEISKI